MNSVLSVVRRIFNHREHGMHGLGAAALPNNIHSPLHSVNSVLSVVRRFFNHRVHGTHGLVGEVHRAIMEAARQGMAG